MRKARRKRRVGNLGKELVSPFWASQLQPTAIVLVRTPLGRLLGSDRSVGCAQIFKEQLTRALSAGSSGSRRRTSGVAFRRGVRDSERVRSEG
jgi:hypothetical protein